MLTGMDGAALPYRVWGDERARRALVLLHEAGLYTRWYEDFGGALARHSVGVFAHDQRGFGDTAGLRGDARSFRLYLDDCSIALSGAAARGPHAEVALCGHGFGGVVALRYCIDRAKRAGPAPAKLILLAPSTKERGASIDAAISALVHPAKKVGTLFGPAQSGNPANMGELLECERDPLLVGEVTARWLQSSARAKVGLVRSARSLELPVLQIEGSSDTLIDRDANRWLFAAIGSRDKRLIVFPGAYHALQFEPDLGQLVAPIRDFLAPPVLESV